MDWVPWWSFVFNKRRKNTEFSFGLLQLSVFLVRILGVCCFVCGSARTFCMMIKHMSEKFPWIFLSRDIKNLILCMSSLPALATVVAIFRSSVPWDGRGCVGVFLVFCHVLMLQVVVHTCIDICYPRYLCFKCVCYFWDTMYLKSNEFGLISAEKWLIGLIFPFLILLV